MESGVEFSAVDFPQANWLTVHILAVVAEHEREMTRPLWPPQRPVARGWVGTGATYEL